MVWFHDMKDGICYSLFRFLLPFTLLMATIFRYNLLSFIYGCLMLISPLVAPPSGSTMKRHTGRYLIATLSLSCVGLVTQIVFQIITFATRQGSSDNMEDVVRNNCSDKESILIQIGLQRINARDMLDSCRVVLPDVGASAISLIVYVLCRLIHLHRSPSPLPTTSRKRQQSGGKNTQSVQAPPTTWQPYLGPIPPSGPARWAAVCAARACNLAAPLLVALCGVTAPSILSSVYFLTALGALTLWALRVRAPAPRGAVSALRLCLLIYTTFYLVVTYLCQFMFAVPLWDVLGRDNGLMERILGISRFVVYSCEPFSIMLRQREGVLWTEYMNISLLLSLYFVLALETRHWHENRPGFGLWSVYLHKPGQRRERKTSDNLETCLSMEIPAQSHAMLDSVVGIERADNLSLVSSIGLDTVVQAHESAVGEGLLTAGFVSATVAAGARGSVAKQRSFLKSLALYIMEQSYIGTLVVMMAWSIAYHSWMTFVLLLTACFIWIVPKKRSVCLKLSPIIVLYGEALVLLQYIYSFRLTDSELPVVTPNGYRMKAIGIVRYEYPILPLVVKMGFTSIFLLTLRYNWIARDKKQKASAAAAAEASAAAAAESRPCNFDIPLTAIRTGKNPSTRTGQWMKFMLRKYWIFVCMTLFLLVSLQRPRIIRIVYMALFLICVITFQVSYRLWRFCIRGFWWVVIIYSMLIICGSYTYQFEGVPGLWMANTGLSEQQLENLGFFVLDGTYLFVDLLIPTSFLIVVIVQLHYFQSRFLELTDLNRYRVNLRRTDVADGGTGFVYPGEGLREKLIQFAEKLYRLVSEKLVKVSVVLWRFMEVHIYKAVVINIFIVCVFEVSPLSFLLVFVVTVTLPFRSLQRFVSIFCLFWTSLVLLAKMVIQLSLVPPDSFYTTCSKNTSHSMVNQAIDNLAYIGLKKSDNMAVYVAPWLSIVLILSVQSIIQYHQIQFFNHPAHSRPEPGIVFPDIQRRHADLGPVECAKFFVNYGFFKFGREACFIMTMITMMVRLDVFSVIYALFLGVLLLLSRRRCRGVWPFYILSLILLLLLQYLWCIGLPPGLCWIYPWDKLSWISKNLKIFLFLPDYKHAPLSRKLIVDFIQLLLTCLQWDVWWIEKNRMLAFGGGSNKNIMLELRANKPNPYGDFLSYKKSYLDYIKVFVYFYSFWITLIVVFFAGTSRITLFCMGYLIACFVFLWFGEAMLLKPPNQLNKMWMGLLMYTYIVLLAKCFLQLIGCVFITTHPPEGACWAVQLFNIICLRSSNYEQLQSDKPICSLSVDNAGLSWDAACFVCLLLMTRICKSWYFQHVVTSVQVNHMLSARGAEFINSDLINRIKTMQASEEHTLNQIREKMKRIKDRNMQGKNITESEDHYIVIRSGGPYMFDDILSDDDSHDDDDLSDLDVDGVKDKISTSIGQGRKGQDVEAQDMDTGGGGSGGIVGVASSSKVSQGEGGGKMGAQASSKAQPGGGASSSKLPSGGVSASNSYNTKLPHGTSIDMGGGGNKDWRDVKPTVLPIDIINKALFSGTKEALEVIEGRKTTDLQRNTSMSPRETSVSQVSSIAVDSPKPARTGSPVSSAPQTSRTGTLRRTSTLTAGSDASDVSNRHIDANESGRQSDQATLVEGKLNDQEADNSDVAGLQASKYEADGVSDDFSVHGSPLLVSSPKSMVVATVESETGDKISHRHTVAVAESIDPSAHTDRFGHRHSIAGSQPDCVGGRGMVRCGTGMSIRAGGGEGLMPVVMEEDTMSVMMREMSHRSVEERKQRDETTDDDDEAKDNADEISTGSHCASCIDGMRVFWAVIENTLDYVISQLYSISAEYRSVSRRLEKERERVMKMEELEARNSYCASIQKDDFYDDDDTDAAGDFEENLAADRISSYQKKKLTEKSKQPGRMTADALRHADEDFHVGMPRLVRLLVALGEALASNSHALVFFTMILNVMLSANLLSIPYPCFIFFWALLSIPRPGKTYWVAMITYTEAVIIIKYMFQFSFIPWNDMTVSSDKQSYIPQYIGVQKSDKYAMLDFLVLFCLFMHRAVLKRHGLWKDAKDLNRDLDSVNRKITEGTSDGDEATPGGDGDGDGEDVKKRLISGRERLTLTLARPDGDGMIDGDAADTAMVIVTPATAPTQQNNEPWWNWNKPDGRNPDQTGLDSVDSIRANRNENHNAADKMKNSHNVGKSVSAHDFKHDDASRKVLSSGVNSCYDINSDRNTIRDRGTSRVDETGLRSQLGSGNIKEMKQNGVNEIIQAEDSGNVNNSALLRTHHDLTLRLCESDNDVACDVTGKSGPSPTPSRSALYDMRAAEPVERKNSGDSAGLGNVSQKKNKQLCCVRVIKNMGFTLRQFFTNLRNPQYIAVTDVYALMFACELISFLIIVFGYSSFGPSAADEEDVTSLIKQSRVPFPFLVMVLLQFIIIIVDRALYLRKKVVAKFVFHVFLVILVHVWMFFILPIINDRSFTSNLAAQLFYFVKCLYFGLSCYQIRCGYPTRIIGNFLTKKYNYINLYLFRLFLVIPFLMELRSIMDWMWTDTTLALTSWLQMEDIYSNIFLTMCNRRAEKRYPTQRGIPRHKCVKYGLGGLVLVLLTFIIWLPLLFFAVSTSIYAPNPPISISIKVSIEGFEPIFRVNADQHIIHQISATEHSNLKFLYGGSKKASAFLNYYEAKDIYLTRIPHVSETNWGITYPDETALLTELRNATIRPNVTIYSTFTFSSMMFNCYRPVGMALNCYMRQEGYPSLKNLPHSQRVCNLFADLLGETRLPSFMKNNGDTTLVCVYCASVVTCDCREPNNNFKSGETVFLTFPRKLNRQDSEDAAVIQQLAAMIDGTSAASVEISEIFPQYVSVPANGRVFESKQLYNIEILAGKAGGGDFNVTKTSATFTLREHKYQRYWEMICPHPPITHIPNQTTVDQPLDPEVVSTLNTRPNPREIERYFGGYIVSFNDRVATGLLTIFSNLGIVGLYASFVVVVNRLVRVITHGLDYRIKYDELPNPDYIFNLCRDIYYARETRDFKLEEDLFAKLLYLFRSPELMIKVAKHKIK